MRKPRNRPNIAITVTHNSFIDCQPKFNASPLRDPHAIRPRLHLTPQAAARVWEKLAPAMDAPMGDDRPSTLEDYFDIHIIKPNVPVSIAGLDIIHACRGGWHEI